jgi:hypothetical protein
MVTGEPQGRTGTESACDFRPERSARSGRHLSQKSKKGRNWRLGDIPIAHLTQITPPRTLSPLCATIGREEEGFLTRLVTGKPIAPYGDFSASPSPAAGESLAGMGSSIRHLATSSGLSSSE